LNNRTLVKVLHVDDEENELKFTKIFLEDIDPDLKIKSIADPRKALELLYEEEYDVILSDYKMDIISGIDFAKQVRSFTDIPIILYTGYGSEEVAAQAFKIGMNGYVKKRLCPTHYQDLAEKIKRVVKKYDTISTVKENNLQYSISK
jgi:DNA-binding NtrC family response regulator